MGCKNKMRKVKKIKRANHGARPGRARDRHKRKGVLY